MSTGPADHTDHTDHTQPAEPAEPAKSAGDTESAGATQSAGNTESAKPGPGGAGGWRPWLRENSELGVSALLLLVGLLVLGDTLTMETVAEQRGPVGPRTVPLLVGGALLVVAVALAVDVLRGGRGDDPTDALPDRTADDPADRTADGKPDPSADAPTATAAADASADTSAETSAGTSADWRTVTLLAGIFLASAALIEPLGFPVTGALLFWGSAYALGSRNTTRDPLIAAVLSVATFAVFNTLLGVPLPGGPLMGVL